MAVRVTGRLAGYTTTSKASAATVAVRLGTLRTAAPTIAGTTAVGSRITARPGTWTAGTAFSYQWYADGRAISRATASTYAIASTQLGKRISVRVIGRKSGYLTVVRTSAATARAPKVATPSISGTAAVGSRLTARPGTWTTGTVFSYQWYANGTAISRATASTLAVTSSRIGAAITVKVTGRKSGYASVAKTSKATLRVPKAVTPTVSGSRYVTRVLTAKPGAWTAGTAFTYQWYANGRAISRATKATLKLGTAQAGKKISVRVTGRKSGYTTVSRTSAATGVIGYPSRTTPASLWNCPSWAPIKGNASSMIYHMPGQRFYNATQPEDCFRTETAARAAGYRKAKV
ncbi:sunset domain-containing protein [Microbacterium elymi]|uniref:Uncharacterized protein n=1 Tax=Microbacterium elymi TaxID=2909587 RepID=A0ABY5NL08_9MICO|nr:hypothetical protein [Microbacterium elymi]UUT35850.1 hypothetical protein L2X98_22010 [Microbacterium elymi]